MAKDIRDKLARSSLYAEVLREGAVLLGIFGPIASLEVLKSFPWKLALVTWSLAVVMLIVGVEAEVRAKRKYRELEATKDPELLEL